MITKNKILSILLICLLLVAFLVSSYIFLLSPVDDDEGNSLFKVTSGSSISKIATDLKNQGFIKSSVAFKLYARLNNIKKLQTGTYKLTSSMNSKEIAKKIELGDVVYPNQIKVTFPEGLTIVEMAEILSKHINYSQEEILSAWNDPTFINEVISDFDYLTDDIKATGISYSLNGYLFPETYYLANKNISPQEVAWMMLTRFDEILVGYSDLITDQKLSIHKVITLASIIEYEAKFDEDRPLIAGVFYNRLRDNMRLESCATLEMALGVHKQVYSLKDIRVTSPYNTYQISGLPIGPGNCPGAKSIEAALKPTKHDYYFFLSDIYGDNKTYYASTLTKHNQLKSKYLQK